MRPPLARWLDKQAITPIQKHAALRGIADKFVVYEIPLVQFGWNYFGHNAMAF